MGDDAEYYLEQQEEQSRFEQACKQAREHDEWKRNRKFLFCWADGSDGEIVWAWEPRSTILEVFSDLNIDKQLGSDYFLANRIPIEGDEIDLDAEYDSHLETNNLGDRKFIDGLEFLIASKEVGATHEVIVFSRYDSDRLKVEAIRQKNYAKDLKEEMLAEMLQAMVDTIEADTHSNTFVFARAL